VKLSQLTDQVCPMELAVLLQKLKPN